MRIARGGRDESTVDPPEFNRCIRLDYVGIAATSLLCTEPHLEQKDQNSPAELLETLFENAEALNNKGIFIKCRFLFLHPYSVAANTRIQAETAELRSSIIEPNFPRQFVNVEQLDERLLQQSVYVRHQSDTLDHVQTLTEKIGTLKSWNSPDSPNSLRVRFLMVNPMGSLTIVNNTADFDPYLLSKMRRRKPICRPYLSPVVHADLDKEGQGDGFLGFVDHFRYLWELDTTMDCQDATAYLEGKPRSLSLIHRPSSVRYTAKAARIMRKNPTLSEDDAVRWRTCVTSMVKRVIAEPLPAAQAEHVFITCGWRKEPGGSKPHEFARMLYGYLMDDFGGSDPTRQELLKVSLLVASTDEFLSKQLYGLLDKASIGLILLTADITFGGEKYSKPNVYHEMGYLSRSVGKSKIILMREEGVSLSTNVHDIPFLEFASGRFLLGYGHVLQALHRICSFPESRLASAYQRQIERLDSAARNGSAADERAELQAVAAELRETVEALSPHQTI